MKTGDGKGKMDVAVQMNRWLPKLFERESDAYTYIGKELSKDLPEKKFYRSGTGAIAVALKTEVDGDISGWVLFETNVEEGK